LQKPLRAFWSCGESATRSGPGQKPCSGGALNGKGSKGKRRSGEKTNWGADLRPKAQGLAGKGKIQTLSRWAMPFCSGPRGTRAQLCDAWGCLLRAVSVELCPPCVWGIWAAWASLQDLLCPRLAFFHLAMPLGDASCLLLLSKSSSLTHARAIAPQSAGQRAECSQPGVCRRADVQKAARGDPLVMPNPSDLPLAIVHCALLYSPRFRWKPPKRISTASLSQQLAVLTESIPAISSSLGRNAEEARQFGACFDSPASSSPSLRLILWILV
jgi:hypothetical protein